MKRLKRLGLLIVVVALVMMTGSCTWFLALFNELNVDDISFPIEKLVVAHLGQEGSIYGSYVFLLSEDVDFSPQNGFSGGGEALLMVLSGSNAGLNEGEYDWSDTLVADAIIDGRAFTGVTFVDGSPDNWDQTVFINHGSVQVREELGDRFGIQVDLEGSDPDDPSRVVTVTARYHGEITDEYSELMLASVIEKIASER